MKNKLIKKYQQGDPIEYSRNTNNMFINQRQAIHDAAEKYYKEHPEERDKTRFGEFAFRPVRYAEGVAPYIDTFTGKPILNGQNILTRNGKVVTAKSQDWLDWLAETGQTLPGANLPELYVEYNKDTKDTHRHTGQSWEEMNADVENAPIATTQEWEQQAQNNFEANDIILQNIKKRAADRRSHELTPGVGSLALLGTVGSLAAWNPLAFITSLGAAKIGEETLNFPFQQQGYQSFGDWWLGPDASDTAKETVNLGTWLAGGAGYSTAKMYQAAAKNLAKRLGTEWAAKSLSAMYPAYNPYPQLVLDVPAVEISSSPLRSSKLPGVFFAKTGEVNEGSVAGASQNNWQIKSLLPGNPLEKRVAPDGTVSWSDFEWYLKQKPVEPYDRIHLQRAAQWFAKDKPIPYSGLTQASSDMIPKFRRTTSENLKAYGLDKLGLGTQTEATEHYGFAKIVDPHEGVNPESIVFNNPIGVYDGRYTDGMVHFPNATQHMRGFTIDSEPGIYYFLEGQSDWGQTGLAHGDFLPGSIEEHMAQTSQLRGIQEALLRAAETGNSVMRVPTPETLIKSQYWKQTVNKEGKRKLVENSKLATQKFEEFISQNYPEINTLRQQVVEIEAAYNQAMRNLIEYVDKLKAQHILRYDVSPYSYEFRKNPGSFLPFNKKYLAKELESLIQEVEKTLSEFEATSGKANSLLRQARQDPRAIAIEEQSNVLEKDIQKKYIGVSPEEYQRVLDKYKAFPKHYRRLFGDKAQIRNVTDARGNTWFEVDVPQDMATRNLIFSKIGEANKGSVFSQAVNNLKKAFKDAFGNDPVWNLMERAGIPEEQRATVEKVLIKPNLDPNKNWYTDPWSNITYKIKVPLATDEELINEFATGITSRFKQYKTDPQLKAAIQQEMGWDEETYNNFLKEITKKILEETSVGVSGKEELSGNLASTTHLKIENPNQPTRYATQYLINRDRIAGESNNLQEELQYSKEAGIHEGYHGITSGIDGEKDAIAKGIQNEYPLITQLMERNNQFLQSVAETQEWYNYFNNTPVYKIVSDLEASGFTPEQIEYVTEFGLPRAKSYNHYVLQPQETSARDIVATTLGPGTKNEEQLRNIYTPESFNKFHGKLFSKTGEINKGSAAGASRRPILRKNMHEFSDTEWDAAYEAALAKGNKREMWRLLTLRFQQKAQEYIANGGGDPKILYRGNYRDLVPSFRDNVWLTSDPKYALNFTADRTGGWFPIFDEKKVKPYFVKGSSEQILPGSVIKDLPKDLLMRDWTWTDIANDLVFGVPERVRTYSETLDDLINDAINNGATSQEIMQQFKGDPLINKAYNLGKADVLVGHDSPVKPTGVYKHWIPSSGIEYNVKNPNYVKLAKLITYDDNGNMIPLSQRFNFRLNDRRYGWLIPLLPFLYGNKKDQAE